MTATKMRNHSRNGHPKMRADQKRMLLDDGTTRKLSQGVRNVRLGVSPFSGNYGLPAPVHHRRKGYPQFSRDLAPRHARFPQPYRLIAPEHSLRPPQDLTLCLSSLYARNYTLPDDLP